MTATATSIDPRLAMGGNNPPSTTEIVQSAMAIDHAAILKRRDELLAGVERAPKTVGDDETAGKVADLIRMIAAAAKASEAARVAAKEPHLEAGRAVDGWFKKITDPLTKAKAAVQAPLDAYLRGKADAERRRRDEEAKALAEAAAREAATMQTTAQMDAAIAIEEKAAEARDAAQAKPAEMARTRGDFGSVATLRATWKHEITDETKVPREYLMVNDAAIKAAIKAKVRSIPGIRIYEDQSVMVR